MSHGIDWRGVPNAELAMQYALSKQMVLKFRAAGPQRRVEWRFWRAVQLSASAEVVRRAPYDARLVIDPPLEGDHALLCG